MVQSTAHNVRYPDPATDLDDLFLFEAKRRVTKDRTLSLHAWLYEIDAVLVGQTVTSQYDLDAPPSRPIEVVHDGKRAGASEPPTGSEDWPPSLSAR